MAMGKQILLAEDDLDDRMLFEEVFSDLPSEDYQLITVCDGEEVLEWLGKLDDSSALPHLIILDRSIMQCLSVSIDSEICSSIV